MLFFCTACYCHSGNRMGKEKKMEPLIVLCFSVFKIRWDIYCLSWNSDTQIQRKDRPDKTQNTMTLAACGRKPLPLKRYHPPRVTCLCFLSCFVKASWGVWYSHDAGVCDAAQAAVQGEGSWSLEAANSGPPGNCLVSVCSFFVFLLNLGWCNFSCSVLMWLH